MAERSRADLVARWRELSQALNDERMPESDWRAVTRERDAVQAEIDALDRASKET